MMELMHHTISYVVSNSNVGLIQHTGSTTILHALLVLETASQGGILLNPGSRFIYRHYEAPE